MPNWAIHLLVPLLALLMLVRKEDQKYLLLLLPFAFFPDIYNEMAFIDASLKISATNELLWTFDYGFSAYDNGWKLAQGYVSDSVGTGSLALVFVAGVWASRHRLISWNT